MSPVLSELESLQDTLNASLDAIRGELQAQGLPELSSRGDEPHPIDDSTALGSPRYYEARRTAIAALGRLKSLIQAPLDKVAEVNHAPYEKAGLDIVTRTRLVDCLVEAPDRRKGLHVNELQKRLDVDSAKLRTVLRVLAARGWFIETSEGTFANARPALQLLVGLNGWKYARAPPRSAVANSLVELTTVSKWKFSKSSVETAFQLAHNTNLGLFEYMQANPQGLEGLSDSIEALNESFAPGVIQDFPWKDLDGKTIIDCGGGSGTLAVAISRAFPQTNLKFIIQDRPEVVERGKGYVNGVLPGALEAGRITFEPHDFFTPQKRDAKENEAYVLRWVLHNWSDENASKILRQLAQAAIKGKTKILIIESISVPGIVQEQSDADSEQVSLDDLVGRSDYAAITPPPYIPANFGESATVMNALGLHIMSILNAHPRSLTEWERLLRGSGLEIRRVYALRSILSVIEAVAVE